MATKEWTRSIKGADDVELGISRANLLNYHCTMPESGLAEGVVFVIPDFNDEAKGDEFNALRAHLADSYNLLAVTVEYHCYRSRLQDGAQLDLSDEEFSAMSEICDRHLVALRDRNTLIQALKQLPTAYEFEVRVNPANGDYQNLGVMQALDHLVVLHDLKGDTRFGSILWGNVIAIGKGHGGYLANLVAKFAPNAIRATLASDSYTSPPQSFLFGEKAGNEAPYYYHFGKVRLFPLIRTNWVMEESLPAGFNRARSEVRSLALQGHLASMRSAQHRPGFYWLAISAACVEYTARQQRDFAQALRAEGFEANMRDNMATDTTFPESGSAMLETLFGECYAHLPELDKTSTINWSSSVAYLSEYSLYCFDFDEFGPRLAIAPINSRRPRLAFY